MEQIFNDRQSNEWNRLTLLEKAKGCLYKRRLNTLLIVVTLSLSGICFASAIDTSWQPIGPTASTLFALEADPSSPSNLFAGTNFGGLYKSVNFGFTWSHVESSFSNEVIFALAIDPVTPQIIYAGTFKTGVHKSLDGGNSWTLIDNGLTDKGVMSLVIDPNNPSTLLAATATGLFRSSDASANWQKILGSTENIAFRSLAFEGSTPGLVYAGSSGLGVYRSLDNGISWEIFNDGMGQQTITALTSDPQSPGDMYASSSNGAFRLPAHNTIWENISHNLTDKKINQIMPRFQDQGLLAATDAGTYLLPDTSAAQWTLWSDQQSQLILNSPSAGLIHIAGIFSSFVVTADDGTNFFDANTGMQNRFIGALETLDFSGASSLLYTGSDLGVELTSEIWRSGDALPWFQGFVFDGAIFDVKSNPNHLGTLFIGTERGGVWKSDNWGFDWQQSSTGLVPTEIMSIDQAPDGGTLYAGTSSGLYLSHDDGASWDTGTRTDTPAQISAVEADPERPGIAYYGSTDGKIFRSLDGGNNFYATWQHPSQQGILQLKASRHFNLYLLTTDGKLYTSDDIGLNFFRRADQISENILTVAVDPVRPWIAYVGTLFGGVYRTETNAIDWEQKSQGIDLPVIFSLFIDPANTSTVYAGSKGIVYKSLDSGENWQALAASLPDGFINQLHLDKASGKLYASVESYGVYQSTDDGKTWATMLEGDAFSKRIPIAVGTGNNNVLLAGSYKKGIYRSVDAGNSWRPNSDGMTLFVRSIALDPGNSDTLYAGSLGGGVFKTTDAAQNWSSKGLSQENIFNVKLDPDNSTTVYAATTQGIARSQDGGDSWENLAYRAPFIFDLVSDPANPDSIYAVAAEAKVYHSNTGGVSWETLPEAGLPNDNLIAIALNSDSGELYVGSEFFGIFKLIPGASAWENTGLSLSFETKVVDISIQPISGAILVATTGDGFFRSDDAGAHWLPISSGISSLEAAKIVTDPFNPDRLFAGVFNTNAAAPGFYRSVDGGQTWQGSLFSSSSRISIAVSPHTADLVFRSGNEGVERSNDGGETWTAINSGLADVGVLSLMLDPQRPNYVYAGTDSGTVYVSYDNGNRWIMSTLPVSAPVLRMAPGSKPGSLYAATLGDGVLFSADSATTWTQGSATGIWKIPVLFIAIDPQQTNTLYVATGGQGMFKTIDGGIHWTQANQGLGSDFLLTLEIDPVNPDVLYVGTAQAGVYITEDGASSWRPFNTGLFNKTVTALHVDKGDNTIIYAGTEGGGVFKNQR